VNAGENFSLLAAADRVRLDNCESAFDGHEKSPPISQEKSPARCLRNVVTSLKPDHCIHERQPAN
jgi:hypothetical protein